MERATKQYTIRPTQRKQKRGCCYDVAAKLLARECRKLLPPVKELVASVSDIIDDCRLIFLPLSSAVRGAMKHADPYFESSIKSNLNV
jgi:hypothetical protein